MNAAAWKLLAEQSRALVHHASLLMGVLTDPGLADDNDTRAPVAARAAQSAQDLVMALVATPELAAHQRTVQRFETSLIAWQRSVRAASPLQRRYQTALLQHAAQLLLSCLHMEALALSECARVEATPFDVAARTNPSTP